MGILNKTQKLGAIGAIGSAAIGAVASGIQNRKARKILQQERDENEKWYNMKSAEDYTQRSDAQAIFNKQRELLDKAYNNASAANVVAGGTSEAEAMQKAAANDAMAQTMSDVAANASNYKDSIEQQYRNKDAALAQQQAQAHTAQGQQIAQAAGQAVNASVGLIGTAKDQVLNSASPDLSNGSLAKMKAQMPAGAEGAAGNTELMPRNGYVPGTNIPVNGDEPTKIGKIKNN